MRDNRFVAAHRSGPTSKEKQHNQLIGWACACAGHVLSFWGDVIDERLDKALSVARAWKNVQASVGEARAASLGAIAVARAASGPAAIAIARAVGHAVATDPMADHSLKVINVPSRTNNCLLT